MRLTMLTLTLMLTLPLHAEITPAPENAQVYFIQPENGASLKSPVQVVFGLRGMGVAPAGTQRDETGHHHLIIDSNLPVYEKPIPANENYRHFGKGQTEALIKLTPGKHTLQLLLGDWKHVPHKPVVASDQITIIVSE